MVARVLVVGTTPDYVQWISDISRKNVFFLTDLSLRKRAIEPKPDLDDEICWDLSDTNGAILALQRHIHKFSITVSGITSFDCESMELASLIAIKLCLFFQPPEAIIKSRDKFTSKRVWQEARLNIPAYSLLNSKEDAEKFHRKINGLCVLKPLSGAGSELVFKCKTSNETKESFSRIKEGLISRQDNRLYNSESIPDKLSVLAEEFIEGTEYSCDFIIENDDVTIIRLTEKIKLNSLPFGIIAGYRLISKIPGISHITLIQTLTRAAKSIGFNKTICMIDFIVRNKKIFLIEIAPRPGGDCLPSLLFCASRQNILEMNINLAAGKKVDPIDYRKIKPLTALRIFSPKEGVLSKIGLSSIINEKGIKAVNFTASIGRTIKLPPEDYDTWILGNYIFEFNGLSSELSDIYDNFNKKLQLVVI